EVGRAAEELRQLGRPLLDDVAEGVARRDLLVGGPFDRRKTRVVVGTVAEVPGLLEGGVLGEPVGVLGLPLGGLGAPRLEVAAEMPRRVVGPVEVLALRETHLGFGLRALVAR